MERDTIRSVAESANIEILRVDMNFDELMAEIQHYQPNKIIITSEQKKFLIEARKKGIPYTKMSELWCKVDGWPKIKRQAIAERCKIVLSEQSKR